MNILLLAGLKFVVAGFTKIPRVELSVADNVVDWTILNSTICMILQYMQLGDHHHDQSWISHVITIISILITKNSFGDFDQKVLDDPKILFANFDKRVS